MASPKGEASHEQDVHHLFRAIRRGKAHLTKFMLAASNNELLKCWNTDGRTPLIECCYIWEEVTRSHMVRILKDAGADVNMKDKNGKTALIHACEQRCNDVVKILIQHANISPDVEDADGNTALIHSAHIGNDVALELLVKNFRRLGLNVDHYNKAGSTALHVATANGFIQCAKVLALKGKASLTLKDKIHQMTPLEMCLKEGYQKSEVEFLKPSAKFYRVAKLTTTMAKYRKKSTQETPGISPAVSPIRVIEKPKSKVKSLLRKSKAQSKDEADLGAVSSHSQKPAENKSSEKNVMSKLLEKSKASFFTKDSQKQTLGKTPRQRSFSQSDQQEDIQAAAKVKSGLSHSHSHPLTSNCLEISAVSTGSNGAESRGRNEHQGYITLAGEYAEWDTEDPDDDFLAIDSSFLQRHRGKTSHLRDGRVTHGKTSPGGSENPSSSTSRSEYGGVYCGSSASASNTLSTSYSGAGGSHDSNDTQNARHLHLREDTLYDEDAPLSQTSTPSPAFIGSGLQKSYLTSDSNDESISSSEDETELKFLDKVSNYKPNILPENVINDFTECRIANQDLAAAGSLAETGESDVQCTLQSTQNMSTSEKSLPVDNTTLNKATSLHMRKLIPSAEIELGCAETEINTFSSENEIEKVDYKYLLDSSNVHRQSSDRLPSFNSTSTNTRPENPIDEKPPIFRDTCLHLRSPETESANLEHESCNTFPEQGQPETFEEKTKRGHSVTRSQSECVHQRRSVRMSRTDAASPLAEIEFLDLSTDNTEMRNHKHREESGQNFDENDDDDDTNDVNDAACTRSTVKNSLNSCMDDVIRIVDEASSEDFVVDTNLVPDLRDAQGDSKHSSCA